MGPKKERFAINRCTGKSFNLYHRVLSDSRNSRVKFISYRVAERGRLFTVIARCEIKNLIMSLISSRPFVYPTIHFFRRRLFPE